MSRRPRRAVHRPERHNAEWAAYMNSPEVVREQRRVVGKLRDIQAEKRERLNEFERTGR